MQLPTYENRDSRQWMCTLWSISKQPLGLKKGCWRFFLYFKESKGCLHLNITGRAHSIWNFLWQMCTAPFVSRWGRVGVVLRVFQTSSLDISMVSLECSYSTWYRQPIVSEGFFFPGVAKIWLNRILIFHVITSECKNVCYNTYRPRRGPVSLLAFNLDAI